MSVLYFRVLIDVCELWCHTFFMTAPSSSLIAYGCRSAVGTKYSEEMSIFTEGTFQGSISLRFPDYRISHTVPSENKNACEIDETRCGIREQRGNCMQVHRFFFFFKSSTARLNLDPQGGGWTTSKQASQQNGTFLCCSCIKQDPPRVLLAYI